MEYFFNRVYIEDIYFRDIQMTDKHAILIGEDEHLFIEHSIFNQFVSQDKELITSFEEGQLIKFKLLSKKEDLNKVAFETTAYYVGLAKGDLKLFEVTEGGPKLICSFD